MGLTVGPVLGCEIGFCRHSCRSCFGSRYDVSCRGHRVDHRSHHPDALARRGTWTVTARNKSPLSGCGNDCHPRATAVARVTVSSNGIQGGKRPTFDHIYSLATYDDGRLRQPRFRRCLQHWLRRHPHVAPRTELWDRYWHHAWPLGEQAIAFDGAARWRR
jgi:hypothetical protein